MSSKSSYSTILRYTGVLAALGSVVAGILHSCSGYAGFWPWLLAAGPRRQENAKTRVDRRSTRDFALYRCFGRAGLCRGRNHAYSSCSGGLRPWLLAAGPQRQENAKTRVDRRSTRDFALYQGFGRAGLCRGRNPA